MIDEDRQTAADSYGGDSGGSAWKDAFGQHRLPLLMLVLVAVHALILGYGQIHGRKKTRTVSPEVTLGQFQFLPTTKLDGGVVEASFQLHVSLFHQIERQGRMRLTTRQFKVQQEVEQLLREARPEDFEDPLLTELKRQLLEILNATLGQRLIEEVIITDFSMRSSMQSRDHPQGPVPSQDQEEPDPGAEDPIAGRVP